MKNILGLDLGTNSIGWALLKADENSENPLPHKIEMAGSRIIPMDAAAMSEFDRGTSISQTAERTTFRGIRRLYERHQLRRERLHVLLNQLGFLPAHYRDSINFENRSGKFIANSEPKLAWENNEKGEMRFLFQSSFEEMLADFARTHPQLVESGKRIPTDWTIYYLRKKALTQAITKEELAWLILHFNQKRGYYQLRGDDEVKPVGKEEDYYALKVIKVEATDQKKNDNIWYNVHLENGWIYRRQSRVFLDWEGKVKEFIVTTDVDDAGNPKKDKEGQIKRSFRAPSPDDWTLIKKKTELDIDRSRKSIGTYIYDSLLADPNEKIRGKLIRTIERKYYKQELYEILNCQKQFHPELQSESLYQQCIYMLYPRNVAHRENIRTKDFTWLFADDVIFYQRPLKSKKSLIQNCPLEFYHFKDKKTGEITEKPIKCIARSNPYFQEFRLWQFIQNLRIYQREKEVDGKLKFDVDVTADFLPDADAVVRLFDWLNARKEIKQDTLLQSYFKIKKPKGSTVYPYRWNYVEDKLYPCNETGYQINAYLVKADTPREALTDLDYFNLWHLLYSVDDKAELKLALGQFAVVRHLPATFADVFCDFPLFKKEYGSYSEKAIKKLLSLMRTGRYWQAEAIDQKKVLPRIEKLINGEADDSIQARVREQIQKQGLDCLTKFQGLPVWLASYIIYNRHSEATDAMRWEKPADLLNFIHTYPQHELRNPVVQQVILETLRVVHDIWNKYDKIDEIHLELGREMKNPADKRKKYTLQALENEETNLRIKRLLAEFINPDFDIESVRPYSPMQQEILRIYESQVLNNEEIPDDVQTILKKFRESDVKKQPSHNDVLRYKLWLDQKYCSPYTGRVIPLGKLFTPAYEIEHIIPKARFFDDSFSNKVICEAEVNAMKGSMLAYEFIKEKEGQPVPVSFEKPYNLSTLTDYEDFVTRNYAGSRNNTKRKKLLMEDIPDSFIERQLNDSRYISKVIKGLLSNVVREKEEQEAISKNLIVCTGDITERLKRDWGLKDIWNDLMLPRFERLNEKTKTSQFTVYNARYQKNLPSMPLDYQKGFNMKRIDHRHHAMDAIAIACATRNIINYLNNESATKGAKINRYDLQRLICDKVHPDNNANYNWQLKKPWADFTQDAKAALSSIVVSFKQTQRILNRTTNRYMHYNEAGKKELIKQTKGDQWAIRKPLHKDTVSGLVNLRKIKTVNLATAIENPQRIVDKRLKQKINELLKLNYTEKLLKKYFKDNAADWKDYVLTKIPVYYFTNETDKEKFTATRKLVDKSFTEKKILESVTDTGIQKILLKHLKANDNDPDQAFSPDGIDQMNQRITELNEGKPHKPILKVRVYEVGNKFPVGERGNKPAKFVEAAKGTNLYFGIYQSEKGGRNYETISLNVVISLLKCGLSPVPQVNEKSEKLLFYLSPFDLVYVPTEDEIANGYISDEIDRDRIYKMVSSSKKDCFFVPAKIASPIINTLELGANNKAEKAWSKEMIKGCCIPIKVDRLGNITSINRKL